MQNRIESFQTIMNTAMLNVVSRKRVQVIKTKVN